MELWKQILQKTVLPNVRQIANKPYHNIFHMIYVKDMIDLAEDFFKDEKYIDYELIRAAAICHDLGHRGDSRLPDSANIEKAKAIVNGINYIDLKNKVKIIELIEDTEYPYKNFASSINGGILRDADLMMCYSSKFFHETFMGLVLETGINTDVKSLISRLDETVKFMEAHEWQTTWGEDRWYNENYLFYDNISKVRELLE